MAGGNGWASLREHLSAERVRSSLQRGRFGITAFTQEFDAAILAMLQDAADVAEGLRELQLQCLRRWRSSTVNFSTRSLRRESSEALPLIWGSYQVLGVKQQG